MQYKCSSLHCNAMRGEFTAVLVYPVECNLENCKNRNVGESERMLKDRISEHVGYIRTKKTNIATGEHFNMPGPEREKPR